MSLLIKALEQAARDRKANRAEAGPGENTPGPETPKAEPLLEPPPPPRPARDMDAPRMPVGAAPSAPAAAPDEPMAAPFRKAASPSEPSPAPRAPAARARPGPGPAPAPAPAEARPAAETREPRRTASSLSSLSQADSGAQRARAAAVMQAGGQSAGFVFAWLRANPVMMLGALALLFGLAFGIYVYLEIAHPGWKRSAPPPPPASPVAAAPALPAVPAPTPSTPGIAPPDLGSAAGTGSLAGTDAVLSPPGTQPVGPAASTGSIGPALPPVVAEAPSLPPPLSSGGALASASVIGSGGGAPSAARAATAERSERAEAPRLEERGGIRVTEREPAVTVAAAPAAPRSRRAREEPVEAAPPARRDGIAVSPTAQPPRVSPTLSQAYASLQAGDYEAARTAYNRVVQTEPLNVDALLGLAYVAAQENRTEDATQHYLRILQINPRHAVAQAALIGLMGRADPGASESRLKQLISREPSAFLHFVLGNVYADGGQWSQAQQAYFQAHHLEPDNPDYAYNLAVGLDQLRQPKLALTYYRRAEQLALGHGRSNFNVAHARERIRNLAAQAD